MHRVSAVLNSSEILLTYWIITVSLYIAPEEGRFSSRQLRYEVSEFLWIFIKHQIVSYVLNLVVENLLILIHDLFSADQAKNDSSFYVI